METNKHASQFSFRARLKQTVIWFSGVTAFLSASPSLALQPSEISQTPVYERLQDEINTELSTLVEEIANRRLTEEIANRRLTEETANRLLTDKTVSERASDAPVESVTPTQAISTSEAKNEPPVDKQPDLKSKTAATAPVALPSAVQKTPQAPQMLARLKTRKTLPAVTEPLKRLDTFEFPRMKLSGVNDSPLIFDIPVTYNERVRRWIRYFQNEGRITFKNWLERSARYLPILQYELLRAGLPQDLGYVAMIESGFIPHAVSHAGAMGMWQFIAPTAERYGLKIDWWIDERKDFMKSTKAAIRYMTDLNQQFSSWYLVAASYNMGENGVRRLLQRHRTNNYWELADLGVLPQETTDYVPKIMAAILMSKAPALYGFRDLDYHVPLAFDSVKVPGGTDIVNLASYLGVSEKYLRDLNPELIKGFIPADVRSHTIRVPKGASGAVTNFVRRLAKNDTLIRAY